MLTTDESLLELIKKQKVVYDEIESLFPLKEAKVLLCL